ncbi:hypothetical protein [Sphingomonas phyllosphaerae]|uniref:hypothetical protein n=1 Tax=Sphingomonas phyllosphaerae TaxID=257003 RepID=UPI0012DF22B4|nr:hypothetical protein [Sphingomonas phyllosphaerae]
MRSVLKAAAVASLLMAIPTAGAEPIVGGGYADCSVLLDNNAFNVNQPNMQWLLGYLSGAAMSAEAMNQVHHVASDLPGAVSDSSAATLVTRARQLCLNDRSDKLWQVATAMMIDLGR